MSDDENEKAVGMTPLREAAMSAHEMYLAFKEAGFSRGEALELVAKMVIAGIQANTPEAGASDE